MSARAWLVAALCALAWSGCAPGEEAPGERPLETVKQAVAPDTPDLNGGGGGTTTTASFTEGDAEVSLTPDATLNDDDGQLQAMFIGYDDDNDPGTAEAFPDGADEILAADAGGTGLVVSYDANSGLLSVTGPGTVADFQSVLQTLSYENTSENPTTTSRTIGVLVVDPDTDSALEVLTLSVSAVNDDPVLTVPGAQTTDANATATIGGISVADVDEAGGDLKVTISVTNGTASLSGVTGLSFDEGDGTDDATMEFTGALSDINDALNNLDFIPTTDFEGDGTVSITVDDQGNTGDGGAKTDSDSITVTVNGEPTVATNGGLTVDEGAEGTVGQGQLETLDPNTAAGNLTYTMTAAPSNGTLKLSGANLAQDDTFTQADINAGDVTYEHDGGETTSDSFGFSVTDGTTTINAQTFSITVTAIDDAPVIDTNAGLTVDEGQEASITTANLDTSDADTADAQLVYTVTTLPSNGDWKKNAAALAQGETFTQADLEAGNVVSYEHDGGETTSDSIIFSISDGETTIDNQTFSITVNAVNDPPVLVNNNTLTVGEAQEGAIPNTLLRVNDADNANNEIQFTVVTAPAEGNLRNNGASIAQGGTFTQADINAGDISYLHGGGNNNTDSFVFTVSDGNGGTIGNQTFNVSINEVNDPPAVVANEGLTLDEGATGAVGRALLETSDEEDGAGDITYTLNTAPSHGNLRNNGANIARNGTFTQADINAGNISYQHNGNEQTSDSFVFTVADSGGLSVANQTFDITINPINDEPVLDNNNGLTLDEGATATIGQGRLRVTDADNTNAEIEFTVVTAPAEGNLRNNGANIAQGGTFTQADINNNRISYQHDGGETTSDVFLFAVSDGDGGTINNTTFNITVNPVNDQPVINTLTGDLNGQENTVFSFNAAAADAEPGALEYCWNFGDGSQEVCADNQTSINHTYVNNGNFTLTLTVTDAGDLSDSDTLGITVTNVAPVVTIGGDDPITIAEGTTLNFNSNATDQSPADVLTFTWDYGDETPEDTGVNLDDPSHLFDDGGDPVTTFPVTLTVNDGDDTEQDTVSVIVSNVAPTANAGADLEGVEGSPVQFNGIISDPSVADTQTLTFVWDFTDGTTEDADLSPTHIFDNQGTYSVTLTVEDKDGGEDTDTVTVVIANVPPTVDLGNNITVNEGVNRTFTATVADPGNDTLTYTWNFGDGSAPVTGEDLDSVSHTYDRPGNFTVSLSVSDGTVSESDSIQATVNNVQPNADTLVVPGDGDEGEELTFNVSATEPGSDPDDLTYTWNFGDGTILADAGPGVQRHTYRDEGDGDFDVTLTIADGEGENTVINRTVDVSNVRPNNVNAGPDDSVPEGTPYTFNGSAQDAGVDDVLTFSWNFRDGNTDSGVNLTNPQHTFADNGDFNVRLTVSDGDGGSRNNDARITVTNVNPSVNLGNNRTVGQGIPVNFTSNVVDPGDANGNDEQLDYTWAVNCNQGQFPGCNNGFAFNGADSGRRLEEVNLTFTQSATYTLTLTVEDKDGGSGSDSIEIVVQNGIPLVTAEVNVAEINEGQSVRLTATAEDLGLDVLEVDLDFDDGTTESFNHQPNNGNYAPIVRNHTYRNEGEFTISVVATDVDDAEGNASVIVQVNNVPPTVELDAQNGQEGVPLTITADVTDPGLDDDLTYTWTFGDGQSQETNVPTVTHTYANDGQFNLTLSVNDETDTTTESALVTIANVLPQVTFNNFNAAEGVATNITVTANDVAADNLTYQWNFGDGSQPVTTNVPTVTHTFPDNDQFTVELAVLDDDGRTEVSANATVANVDPTAELGNNITRPEGQPVTFNVTAADVPADTLTYQWAFGDGQTLETDVPTATHTYANDTQRTARVTVRDDDGGSVQDTVRVNFTNVAPTASAGDFILERLEGSPVTFDGAGADPGDDELLFTWDFGDEGGDSGVDLTAPVHTYNDEGSYTVTLTVDDQEGGTDEDETLVTVLNVAPVATLDPQAPVNEGDNVTYTVNVVEPGHDDLEVCFDFNDGTDEVCLNNNINVTRRNHEFTVQHQFPDNGSFDVEVTVTDEDLAVGTDTITVQSANLPPSIDCTPPTVAQTGVLYEHNFDVVDPGTADTLTYTVIRPGEAQIDQEGRLTFTTEQLDGSVEFAIRVSDDDGEQAFCSWTVNVGFGDQDEDGAPDLCEQEFSECLDVNVPDGDQDADGDGLTNARECIINRNPCVSNVPDPPPSVRLPVDGDVVTAEPVRLSVNNAFDADVGDRLTYLFELYEERIEGDPVLVQDDVPETLPFTSATLDFDFEENGQYCWRAAAFDGAGFSAFSDPSACFIYSLFSEPPSEPEAREPVISAATLTPNFVWTNSIDPERQALSYRLTIVNEDDETVFTQNDILPEPGALTTFNGLPNGVLDENETYIWTVQALDIDGEVSELSGRSSQSFTVNVEQVRPGASEFLFPENNAIISDLANFMVVASEARDEDGDIPVYDFRLATSEDFSTVLRQARNLQVGEGDGVVVWSEDISDIALSDNQRFFIEVRARDFVGAGPATVLELVFSDVNNAPPQVATVAPINDIATVAPAFEWNNVADPEGEAVTYDLEVTDVTAGAQNVVVSLQGLLPDGEAGDQTEMTVSAQLSEDRSYTWQVRAVDASGEAGPWSDPTAFRINVGDSRPSAPTLLSPTGGEQLDSGENVDFVWENAADPDGDALSYTLDIFNDSGVPVASDIPVEEGGDGMTAYQFTDSVLEPGGYTWRVKAISDAGGNRDESPFSTSAVFIVSAPEVETPDLPENCSDYIELGLEPPGHCAAEIETAAVPKAISGCQQSGQHNNGGSGAPLALFAFLAALAALGRAVIGRVRA